MAMLRYAGVAFTLLALGGQPASSQERAPQQRVQLLVAQAVEEDERDAKAVPCVEDDYATVISGEIVVCGRSGETSDGVWDKGDWERRHAAETMTKHNPLAPEAFGIPNHGRPIVGPPPVPAIMIDIEALPEAPPGSDADRVARGLAPLGSGGDAGRRPATPIAEEPLGLPPPPDFEEVPVSPEGSEAPGAGR